MAHQDIPLITLQNLATANTQEHNRTGAEGFPVSKKEARMKKYTEDELTDLLEEAYRTGNYKPYLDALDHSVVDQKNQENLPSATMSSWKVNFLHRSTIPSLLPERDR
jgi:hypothetical protein